jgi:hypothetical protein
MDGISALFTIMALRRLLEDIKRPSSAGAKNKKLSIEI